jgi:hypothetical protein
MNPVLYIPHEFDHSREPNFDLCPNERNTSLPVEWAAFQIIGKIYPGKRELTMGDFITLHPSYNIIFRQRKTGFVLCQN